MNSDEAVRPVLRVGVTGHRVLPEPARIEQQIEECLRKLLGGRAGGCLTLASALASGADQLAAHCVLDRLQGSVDAYLPFPIRAYEGDFDEYGAAELRLLVARATRVWTGPPDLTSREASYEWAGRAVVDASDWLLTCWDGLPSRGRGGTAEIVLYARDRGVPVIRIDTNPGGGVIWPDPS